MSCPGLEGADVDTHSNSDRRRFCRRLKEEADAARAAADAAALASQDMDQQEAAEAAASATAGGLHVVDEDREAAVVPMDADHAAALAADFAAKVMASAGAAAPGSIIGSSLAVEVRYDMMHS